MFALILVVLAFVLFLIAGVPAEEPWPYRTRLVCFGLAAFALAEVIVHAVGLKLL